MTLSANQRMRPFDPGPNCAGERARMEGPRRRPEQPYKRWTEPWATPDRSGFGSMASKDAVPSANP